MSKTLLTELSPGFMVGPSDALRSSDSRIVAIEGSSADPVAWARAVSPGRADIRHTRDGSITPVFVESDGEPLKSSTQPAR